MHPSPAKTYSRSPQRLNGHVLNKEATEQPLLRRTSGGGVVRTYLLHFAATLCAFIVATTLVTSWSAINSRCGTHNTDGSTRVAQSAVAAAIKQLQQNQSEVVSLLNQLKTTQTALAKTIDRAHEQASSRAEQQTAVATSAHQTAADAAAAAALPALTKLHNSALRQSKDFERHRQLFKELLDHLVHIPAAAAMKEVQLQLSCRANDPVKLFVNELYKLMLDAGTLIPCREDSTLVIGDTVGLKDSSSSRDSTKGSNIPKYYFATNLKDNSVQMPHYILNLLQTLLRLPRDRAFVSVYESNSDDGIHNWIEVMQLALNVIGTHNRVVTRGMMVRTDGQYRIEFLAKVRNLAMAPLYSYYAQQQQADSRKHGSRSGSRVQPGVLPWDPDYVVFINDVFFCWGMVMRLMNYRADITCGTDWTQDKGGTPKVIPPKFKDVKHHGTASIPAQLKLERPIDNPMAPDQYSPIVFYDVWVSRDVGGNRFKSKAPFIKDRESSPAVRQGLPVRASCCWNGLAILRAEPFKRGLRFRMHQEGECRASECTLMCNDFARMGFTNVVVDPGVQVTYDWHLAREMMAVGIEGVGLSTWAQVRANGISQATRQPDYTYVECCELKPGQPWVWFDKDCLLQNIMGTNYTKKAMESNTAWEL